MMCRAHLCGISQWEHLVDSMKKRKRAAKKKKLMVNKAVYDALMDAASRGKPVYYGELAKLMELNMMDEGDRTKLFKLLENITVYEHKEGRPLLSAIVISRANKMPGYGFFKLARRLGVQKQDNTTFFYAEVRKVFDYWRGKLKE